MLSLQQPVRRMAAYLPGALVSAEAIRRIETVAGWFPAAVTDCLCFELGLTDARPSADFAFLCRRDSAGARILAGLSPVALPEALAASPVWMRVRDVCRTWMAEGSPLRDHLTHLIVEVDVRGDDRVPVPCIYLGAARDRPAGVEWIVSVVEALGSPVSRQLRDNWQRLQSAVLADRSVHVGVMLSRHTGSVRLVFDGVNAATFELLEDLGATGVPELAAIARRLASLADVINVAIDLGDSIDPRIGLECKIAENVRMDRGRWNRLLDYLVSLECCTESNRDAVLRWPGGSVERLPHLVLPAAVVRKISHFKIVRQPGAALEAKAYLFAVL
jgi:hypothetical protein